MKSFFGIFLLITVATIIIGILLYAQFAPARKKSIRTPELVSFFDACTKEILPKLKSSKNTQVDITCQLSLKKLGKNATLEVFPIGNSKYHALLRIKGKSNYFESEKPTIQER